jgi:hypothetical protein
VNVRHTIDHLLGDLSLSCLGVFCHLFTRFNIDATKSDVAPPKWSPASQATACLPANGLSGALTRTCVRLGTLATQRQTLAVTETAVTTKVHQSLDVHGHLASQVTLDVHLGYQRPQLVQLTFRQLTNFGALGDVAYLTQFFGLRFTNAKDMGQRNDRMLVIGDVDSGDTRHVLSPHLLSGAPVGARDLRTGKKGAHVNDLSAGLQESALTLLVAGI